MSTTTVDNKSHVLSSQQHSLPINRSEQEWAKSLTPSQLLYRSKATEPRGLTRQFGGFDDFFPSDGTFLCSNCEWPLFSGATKFDCGCGWPGFYDALPGAVFEIKDQDGVRREILCNQCGAHLGHWTNTEDWDNPAPNERHCVASIALKYQSSDNNAPIIARYNGPLYCSSHRPATQASNKFGTVYADLRGGEAPDPSLIEPNEVEGHLMWIVATDLRRVAILDAPSEFVPTYKKILMFKNLLFCCENNNISAPPLYLLSRNRLSDLKHLVFERLNISNEDEATSTNFEFLHNGQVLKESTKIDNKFHYLEVRGDL
jgi:peptide-methionine (R)-S-oxide reductase